MTRNDASDLDQRIAALEAELAGLKALRSATLEHPPKVLDGIKILDMSRFIFGPFCTQMLGDMGAEIIKVEPLGLGDPSRAAGNVMVNGISASYLARNRNKRSWATLA